MYFQEKSTWMESFERVLAMKTSLYYVRYTWLGHSVLWFLQAIGQQKRISDSGRQVGT